MKSWSGSSRLLLGAVVITVLGVGLVALIDRGRLLPGLDSVRSGGVPEIPADSALEARAMVEECGELGGQQKMDCYQAALVRSLEDVGVRPTMNTLDYLVLLDKDARREAHVYAHHVGIEAYEIWPDVETTFTSCTESFSSGCYHGVIQAYFEDRGLPDAEVVEALCEPYKSAEQSRWILFQCIHGMGHGLTMYYGHDLPRALEACDLLRDNWDRQSCYGGAFMENVTAAISPHHPANSLAAEDAPDDEGAADHSHGGEAAEADSRPEWLAIDASDPHYPCSVMEARYLHQCYLMQTSVMLHLNGWDLVDASRSCDLAPPAMRPTCHQSLGRSVTARTKDPREAESHCRAGSEPYRGWCYVGVVKAFVDWTSRAESGLAFCRVIDDPGHKSMCYKGLGEEIASLIADEETRSSLCAQSEEEFEESCRRGARLPM